MATESNAPSVDPHIVGNAFVQKYYNHLYESPSEVHKFYLENSKLSRPGLSITSLKVINDQIMSVDYKNSKIQILSADSQPSLKNSVATLVTGLVIGKDGGRRTFSQSFILVPRNGSYFVLNDTFRYVSDEFVAPEATTEVEESPQVFEPTNSIAESTTDVEESPQVFEPTNSIAEPAKEIVEAVIVPTQAKTTVTKPANAIANGHPNVPKDKVVNGNSSLPEAAEAKLQEEAPKKSFAVIVQSLAQNGGSFHVKASPTRPKCVEKQTVTPEPKASSPVPKQASAKTIEQPAKGGSIFVANLPMDATTEQLYETFKGFGAIRKDGIQVRSYPEKKNCFGFVAFENGEAIKNVFLAHKESPIRIGNRRASIEEKRGASNNQNGNRSSARNNGGYYRKENGYRNDGYKPQGNGVDGGRGKSNQNNGHGNNLAKH